MNERRSAYTPSPSGVAPREMEILTEPKPHCLRARTVVVRSRGIKLDSELSSGYGFGFHSDRRPAPLSVVLAVSCSVLPTRRCARAVSCPPFSLSICLSQAVSYRNVWSDRVRKNQHGGFLRPVLNCVVVRKFW